MGKAALGTCGIPLESLEGMPTAPACNDIALGTFAESQDSGHGLAPRTRHVGGEVASVASALWASVAGLHPRCMKEQSYDHQWYRRHHEAEEDQALDFTAGHEGSDVQRSYDACNGLGAFLR